MTNPRGNSIFFIFRVIGHISGFFQTPLTGRFVCPLFVSCGIVVATRTLLIIKPDAVRRNAVGEILKFVEERGFRIVEMEMTTLTCAQAAEFYAVHRARPFYPHLIDFMTSGPSVPAVLECEDAVARLRQVVGATDPARAVAGTIRKAFGCGVQENAAHASDSPENGAKEIAFFFGEQAVSG